MLEGRDEGETVTEGDRVKEALGVDERGRRLKGTELMDGDEVGRPEREIETRLEAIGAECEGRTELGMGEEEGDETLLEELIKAFEELGLG